MTTEGDDMEEITVNAIQMISSYGALGAVAVYFMAKDWSLNKEIKEALSEFRIALETLIKLRGSDE